MLSLKPQPFVQSSFDVQAPREQHVFLSFFFRLFGDVAFSEYLCHFRFLLYVEYVVRSFLPNDVLQPKEIKRTHDGEENFTT